MRNHSDGLHTHDKRGGEKNMNQLLISAPILALIAILATQLAYAHTAAYNLGFNAAKNGADNNDICDQFTGKDLEHCRIGYADAVNGVSSQTQRSSDQLTPVQPKHYTPSDQPSSSNSPFSNNGPGSGSSSSNQQFSSSNENNGPNSGPNNNQCNSNLYPPAFWAGWYEGALEQATNGTKGIEKDPGALNTLATTLGMSGEDVQAFVNGHNGGWLGIMPTPQTIANGNYHGPCS